MRKAALFLIAIILGSGSVFAGHDDSTVGSAPAWDANLTYLGTFSGTDSAAAILALIGVNVMEIAKADPPGTSSNGLSVTCAGSCASQNGTWSYSGSETVAYLVIKAGSNFALYRVENGATSGTGKLLTWWLGWGT